MKSRVLTILSLFVLTTSYSCRQSSISGDWAGKGIKFTVNETEDSITKLEVVIPYGNEFLAQWYENLKIENNKFSSYQSGNSYVGIPERKLEGEFVSGQLAKGKFNNIEWMAERVK